VLEGHATPPAVICCVGLRRANPANPFSRLVSPPDLVARTAQLLVEAAGRHGFRRIVAISAAGVGDSAAATHWFIRAMISISKLGPAYRDLNAMEATFAATSLDWLAVRAVTLVDGEPTGTARKTERYEMKSTITRGEVGRYLVDAATRPEPFGEHAVMIAG
jgi:hypothetical protein